MKTLGIVAHSAEGASLCFLTACRHGADRLGPFMHPNIVMSAIPMGLSMPAWEADDHAPVAEHLAAGVRMVADAGADLWVCPDNTAHIVLEQIAADMPIPGMHIADVVGAEIAKRGFTRVGLMGTKWTMTGPVYERAMRERGLQRLIPPEDTRRRINDAIFNELCKGVFRQETTQMLTAAADELRNQGAECAILGCTELPLVMGEHNTTLPVIDSTRLQAQYAVDACLNGVPWQSRAGWVAP